MQSQIGNQSDEDLRPHSGLFAGEGGGAVKRYLHEKIGYTSIGTRTRRKVLLFPARKTKLKATGSRECLHDSFSLVADGANRELPNLRAVGESLERDGPV